jgi:hypothetical protein
MGADRHIAPHNTPVPLCVTFYGSNFGHAYWLLHFHATQNVVDLSWRQPSIHQFLANPGF